VNLKSIIQLETKTQVAKERRDDAKMKRYAVNVLVVGLSVWLVSGILGLYVSWVQFDVGVLKRSFTTEHYENLITFQLFLSILSLIALIIIIIGVLTLLHALSSEEG